MLCREFTYYKDLISSYMGGLTETLGHTRRVSLFVLVRYNWSGKSALNIKYPKLQSSKSN